MTTTTGTGPTARTVHVVVPAGIDDPQRMRPGQSVLIPSRALAAKGR